MNKFFKIYLNWRIHVLTILTVIVTLLVASSCEDLLQLFLTKIAGIGMGYLTFRLGKYWNSKGKIDELMELADED